MIEDPLLMDEDERRRRSLLGRAISPDALTLGGDPSPLRLQSGSGDMLAGAATRQLGGAPPPPPVNPYRKVLDQVEGAQGFRWNPESPVGQEALSHQSGKLLSDALSGGDAGLKRQNIQSQIDARAAKTAGDTARAPGRLELQAAAIKKAQAQVDAMKAQDPLKAKRLQAILDKEAQALHLAQATEGAKIDTANAVAHSATVKADNAESMADADIAGKFAAAERSHAGAELDNARTAKVKLEASHVDQAAAMAIAKFTNDAQMQGLVAQLKVQQAERRKAGEDSRRQEEITMKVKNLLQAAKMAPGRGWFSSEPSLKDKLQGEASTILAGAAPPSDGVGLSVPQFQTSLGGAPAAPTVAPLGTVSPKSTVPQPNMNAGAESPGTDIAVPATSGDKPRLADKYRRAGGGDQSAIEWLTKRHLWPRK